MAAGTVWWVNASGTNLTGTGNIRFLLANGNYTYLTENPVPGVAGVRYVTNVSTGSFTVNGAAVTIPIPFVRQFFLTTAAAPANGGTVSPASGWFAAGTQVSISASANASFAFAGWTGTGAGSYTGPAASATIWTNGTLSETAQFGAAFAANFIESGLPVNTNWSVTVVTPSGNVTQNLTMAKLTFYLANGTYNFSVAPNVLDFLANVWSGNVTVNGTLVNTSILWSAATFTVTFSATGLPNGT
ncbi:MAG TPA: hypothetical protein VJS68_01145, partial [Thermoplasmata archaeon]|nr:hypothetical protein [Thermoplasmata archaeon]